MRSSNQYYPLSKYTSWLFLLNATHVWWRGKFFYGVTSLGITYTSVRLRQSYPSRTLDLYIDYIAICFFMFQGWVHWCTLTIGIGFHVLIASTVIMCAFLYKCRREKPDDNPLVDRLEAAVHVVASFGHHLIAWGLHNV